MTAKLLDQVNEMVTKYVAFPSEHHATVVALWVLHTWVVNAFYVTPRLILDSAEPGSGKTRVLELLALLCRAAKLTLSTTTAALYRRIAAAVDEGLPPPTVLQDEADAIFGKTATPQAEDLRALFNAGYRKGATVDRCEGDAKNMRVREFPVHAPVALAGLAGKMPDTIRTRGVTIHMRRRRPDQRVADFRERDALTEAEPIRELLTQWADEHEEGLAVARPDMPDGVTDRSAEIWEPLLAIADLAGGQWPAKARAACKFFVIASASDDEKLSLGQRLLRDIKMLLEADKVDGMWSSDIICKLVADPESEWRDLWGKTLDQRRLAKELNKYGVKSKMIRQGAVQARGYRTAGDDGLQQAWDHWLTPSVAVPSVPSVTVQVEAFHSGTDSAASVPAVPEPYQQNMPIDLRVSDTGTAGTAGTLTSGSAPANQSHMCPDCGRAPARSDTGSCDFCTVKHRRQQTKGNRRTYVKQDGKPSCQTWFYGYLDQCLAEGAKYIDSFAVYQAGAAAGWSKSAVANAVHFARATGRIRTAAKTGRTETWCIDPSETVTYTPVAEFVSNYLDGLPAGTTVIDQEHFYTACDAAGIDRATARKVLIRDSGRIDSQPAQGRSKTDRIWTIRRPDGEAVS